MNAAEIVPSKQVNVEYRRTDHPLNLSPPIVYTTQPITAIKISIEGTILFVAERKEPTSPLVITVLQQKKQTHKIM